MFGHHSRVLVLICVLVLLALPVMAQNVPINVPSVRGDMSGNWFNPEQSGHGVQIEVLDGGRVVVAWYTYDGDGRPLWLFGVGSIDALVVEAELSVFEAGRPPPRWNESSPEAQVWGTVRLEFSGCDQGTLSWDSIDPDFASGELPVVRLTTIRGQRCFAEELYSLQLIYSFERRMQGFDAVFADLPADWDQETYELDYRRVELPSPLSGYTGLRLTGHNRSDDLAMLVKAPVKGLEPDALYWVELDVELASNVPQGCFGIGGSPGESVFVKLGAAGIEPLAELEPESNWLRFNIDFGNQSQSGADALVVGSLENSQSCEDGPEARWELKTFSTQGQQLLATTDNTGTLWVFAGTDSGFEGLTQYYLTSLRVRLEPHQGEGSSD